MNFKFASIFCLSLALFICLGERTSAQGECFSGNCGAKNILERAPIRRVVISPIVRGVGQSFRVVGRTTARVLPRNRQFRLFPIFERR